MPRTLSRYSDTVPGQIAEAIRDLMPLHDPVLGQLNDAIRARKASCFAMSRAVNAQLAELGFNTYRYLEVRGVYTHNSSVSHSPEFGWLQIDYSIPDDRLHTPVIRSLEGSFGKTVLDLIANSGVEPSENMVGLTQDTSVLTSDLEEGIHLLDNAVRPLDLFLPEDIAIQSLAFATNKPKPDNATGSQVPRFVMQEAAQYASALLSMRA